MQYCNQYSSPGGNTFNSGTGQGGGGFYANQQIPRLPPSQNFGQAHGQASQYGPYGYHGHGQSHHSVYQYNYQSTQASSQEQRFGPIHGSFLHERLVGQQHQEGYYYGHQHQQNSASGSYQVGSQQSGGSYPALGYHGNTRQQANYPMYAQPKAIAQANEGMGYVAEEQWYVHDDSKQKAYERFTQNNSRIQKILDETAVNCGPPVVTMERVAVLKEQVGLLQDELTKQSVEVTLERTKCQAGLKRFMDSTAEFNIKYQKLCEPIGQETIDEMAERFYQQMKKNRESQSITTDPPEDEEEEINQNQPQSHPMALTTSNGHEQYQPNGQVPGQQHDISYSRAPAQYTGNHGYDQQTGQYAHQNYSHYPQGYQANHYNQMPNHQMRMPQGQVGTGQNYSYNNVVNGGMQHQNPQMPGTPVYAHPRNHGEMERYNPYQKPVIQQSELTQEERLERAKKSNIILTAYKKYLESRQQQQWDAQSNSGHQRNQGQGYQNAPPPPPLQHQPQQQAQQQLQFAPLPQPPPLEYVGRRHQPRYAEQRSTRVTRSAAKALKNGQSTGQTVVDHNYGMFPNGYAPPQRLAPILFNGGGLVEVKKDAKSQPPATVTSAVAMYGSMYAPSELNDDPLADVVSANENMDRRAAEEKLLKDVWMTPEISVKDATSTSGVEKESTVAANPILANILEAPLLNASGERVGIDALSEVLCAGIDNTASELDAVDLGESDYNGELGIPNFDDENDNADDDVMFGRLELSP